MMNSILSGLVWPLLVGLSFVCALTLWGGLLLWLVTELPIPLALLVGLVGLVVWTMVCSMVLRGIRL